MPTNEHVNADNGNEGFALAFEGHAVGVVLLLCHALEQVLKDAGSQAFLHTSQRAPQPWVMQAGVEAVLTLRWGSADAGVRSSCLLSRLHHPGSSHRASCGPMPGTWLQLDQRHRDRQDPATYRQALPVQSRERFGPQQQLTRASSPRLPSMVCVLPAPVWP